MKNKPVVAMVLPADVAGMMFRAGDLAKLGEMAEVMEEISENAEIVITGWSSPRFDESLLAKAPKLRMISHSAGSVRNVVTDAVYARGIRVTTSAAANAVPVAEFAVAMMVAMLKQVPWLCRGMKEGKNIADFKERYEQARELQAMSVGLIGASRVGREVIRLLRSYTDLDVRVYDPYLSDAEAKKLGVRLVSLEEACGSEVVSVHAPANAHTRHMMNTRTLAMIPDHGVLINTSRGSLVDEGALVEEVKRRPLYVLLDVTDPEPPAKDSPLRTEENILLTPHVAGAMKQARFAMGAAAIDEVLRFLCGQELRDEVTREMLATQA